LKGKLAVAAIVVLAAILVATPVLAVGPSTSVEMREAAIRKPTIISMTATIQADAGSKDVVATGTGRLSVAIQMTNRAFIQYRGDTGDVDITKTTLCVKWVQAKKSIRIACKDLVAESLEDGLMVSINAKVIGDGVFSARRVTISQPRVP
jgi:hypothetical protein